MEPVIFHDTNQSNVFLIGARDGVNTSQINGGW